MFSDDVVKEITAAAGALGLEAALLLAVAEVESGGRAFAVVAGRREPLIRFEGHYFDRRLGGDKQALARGMGLASPVAGAVANPATQEARWRLLKAAAAIDATAAYESVSWGLGQVMGAHWAMLGFASVDALVAEARSGIEGQARLMALYIDRTGLAGALKAHDWDAFARGYNGPGYRKNAYGEKIAAAYMRYGGTHGGNGGGGASAVKHPSLRHGSTGSAVVELQRRLAARGYALAIDGAFGPATAQAVMRFQRDQGLPADGIAGPATQAALAPATDGPLARLWIRLTSWLAGLLRRV